MPSQRAVSSSHSGKCHYLSHRRGVDSMTCVGWSPGLGLPRLLHSHSDEIPEATVLPKDKLVSLCKCDPILKWMRNCDHILYQALVEVLIPDVLRPVPSKQLAHLPLSFLPCTPAATLSGPAQTGTQNPVRAAAWSPWKDAHPCLHVFLVIEPGEKEGGPYGSGEGCPLSGLCPPSLGWA